MHGYSRASTAGTAGATAAGYGTGKVAKTYSRYARNTKNMSWARTIMTTEKTGKMLSVSSDAATSAGAAYGPVSELINGE